MRALVDEYGKIIVIIIVALGLLALARYMTTGEENDARFSSEENTHKSIVTTMDETMKDPFETVNYDAATAHSELKQNGTKHKVR